LIGVWIESALIRCFHCVTTFTLYEGVIQSGYTFGVKQVSEDFIHKARGVSDLKCHLVLTTKYRHKVFTDAMLTRLEAIFKALMEKWEGRLVEFNGERDHVHLLLQYTPQTETSKLINNLKTVENGAKNISVLGLLLDQPGGSGLACSLQQNVLGLLKSPTSALSGRGSLTTRSSTRTPAGFVCGANSISPLFCVRGAHPATIFSLRLQRRFLRIGCFGFLQNHRALLGIGSIALLLHHSFSLTGVKIAVKVRSRLIDSRLSKIHFSLDFVQLFLDSPVVGPKLNQSRSRTH
jgi:hypothetical protein